MKRKAMQVVEDEVPVVDPPSSDKGITEVMDPGKRTSKINTWRPGKNTTYVDRDGKIFVVNFDKIFGIPKLKKYNRFVINKTSYENQLDIITRYTNFFIHFYDKEQELINAYLKLQMTMDPEVCGDLYGPDDMKAFIDFLYQIMFTPTMVQKIKQMVEDNYLDDIENNSDEKKKYYKANEKKHLESLEFTNQHIKILLAISFGMKILCPVMFHFCASNGIKIDKTNLVIFTFYEPLFDLFNEDCNMYNKLYVYVKTKVLESNANNSTIFEQREIFGVDLYSVISQFTKVVLISENCAKYKFNEHWNAKQKKYAENVVGFNKTIIKYQLNYFLKDQYEKTLTEVTNTKNNDGLSGIDKMAMNLDKYDEGTVILADINIEDTMKRIMQMVDIPIAEEEVNYYMEHFHIAPMQLEYIHQFYAKYFGNCQDLALIPKRQLIILALIMKKILLIDLGYDPDTKEMKEAALPYILTGNLEDRSVNRMIRAQKFVDSLEESYKYQRLVNEDYKMLLEIPGKEDSIKAKLSTIVNTKFTYVTYEAPELTGTEITYDVESIADELLCFLEYI